MDSMIEQCISRVVSTQSFYTECVSLFTHNHSYVVVAKGYVGEATIKLLSTTSYILSCIHTRLRL